MSAWRNSVSRKFWLLRGRSLSIVGKAELKAKMGGRLAVADKVVIHLHALYEINMQHYISKNLQGTQAARDITSYVGCDILVRELMEMLTASMPQQSPYRSD